MVAEDKSSEKWVRPRWWEFVPPLVPFFILLVWDMATGDNAAFGFFIGFGSAGLWFTWLAARGRFKGSS